MCTSDGKPTIRRGASFDISFWTETLIPRRSTPSSCALIPMVVLIQVASAVATRSVGENASPLPLLSVGASVEIFDCDGPCVASQCKLPVYLTETSTIDEPQINTRLRLRLRRRRQIFTDSEWRNLCFSSVHQWQLLL